MTKTIPLARYLFTRLRQLGCHSIHGVPGDFFLRALDHVRPSGLNWIGNASELCAGYAADGYARAGQHVAARRTGKGPRLGALFTTYGVGELSAINAVAGSYAESIPVVHFVGTPSRKAWQTASAKRPIHHTLADSMIGMNAYCAMAENVTCASVYFHQYEKVERALSSYDTHLTGAVRFSKPVYVSIPSDYVEAPVPLELLNKPLPWPSDPRPDREEIVHPIVDRIHERVRAAQRPLLIVDGLCYPFDFIKEANELSMMLPTAGFTAGKGVIDESNPNWLGTLSAPIDYQPDLLILLGPMLSDTNTATWTAVPEAKSVVKIGLESVEIDDEMDGFVSGKAVLSKLVAELQRVPGVVGQAPQVALGRPQGPSGIPQRQAPKLTTHNSITQDSFWAAMTGFLASNDTVLLANGTPLIVGGDLELGAQTQVIASSIWCSIGQMLPAAQGVAAAKRDHKLPGRTILFEGDGSFQVTCQALSDIIRYKLDVTIFIVNNAGYTYERWLNGMEAEYNDVPAWKYTEAAKFFGGGESDPAYTVNSIKVAQWSELQGVLKDGKFTNGKGLKVIEVVMEPSDVPQKAKAGLKRASEALRASS